MRVLPFMLLAPWLCLCAAAQSSPSGLPSPFQPGQRWSHAPDPSRPWIPRDLGFVGTGQFLWSAPAQGNPLLELLASDGLSAPGSSLVAIFTDAALGTPSGAILVASGDNSAELFALAQYPVAGGLRQSVVRAYDAQAAARGASFQPSWSSALAQPGNGPAALAATPDGERLLIAAFDVGSGQVQLRLLNGQDGSSLLDLNLDASGLGKLGLSADGTRLLVQAGSRLYVLNDKGQELFRRQAPELIGRPSFSADGAWLVVGGVGALELYFDSGLGYMLVRSWSAATSELCATLELSADGSTLAVGWWDYISGSDVRVQVIDAQAGQVLNSIVQSGSSSGLQNYPVALALNPDGTRIAVGLWGTGDARPEVYLLERGQPRPLLSVDLEGSVYALDLDESGTRVGVGLKDTHANLLSASGRVALFDTGERDLQLLDAVRIGGWAQTRFLPVSATGALFVFGRPAPLPVPLKQGLLQIDLGQPYVLLSGQAEADNSFSSALQVPLDASLVGLRFGVQGVALGAPGIQLSVHLALLEVL